MGVLNPFGAMILLATLCFSLAIVAAAEADAEEKLRNPKLFFVSSTTSTLSTTTICYVSSSSAAACGRKRRAVLIDSESKRDAEFGFDGVTKMNAEDVESSKDELSEVEAAQTNEREGKFLLYWMTTTSTSTTYTATTTVSSLACTPSGFVISNCTG